MDRIDFFARQPHYIDHMAPIHRALGPNAGAFFVPEHLYAHALYRGVEKLHVMKGGVNYSIDVSSSRPIVVASHSDLQTIYSSHRGQPIIMMEHGVGIVFPNNASYAGNVGYRRWASLTLAPNQIIFDKTKEVLPDMRQIVIGTPRLDTWSRRTFRAFDYSNSEIPTIAISFHWDGRHVAPEAGSAFDYYKKTIMTMAKIKEFKLIAHAHPRAVAMHKPFYKRFGIEFVDSFDDVMNRADVYINDCSSTIYEFLVTGKPVIMLNCPQFRRNVNFGIRFWDYTDIGFVANNGDELLTAIGNVLRHPDYLIDNRKAAIRDLYPYLGYASEVAASEIMKVFG